MIFTPDTRLASHEQHSAWATTSAGPRVNVARQYGKTVALYIGTDGMSATLKFADAEALALADELRKAVAAKTALKVAA